MRQPYSKNQVLDVIDRKNNDIVPVFLLKFLNPGLYDIYGEKLLQDTGAFPDDILDLWYQEPGNDVSPLASNPEYRFGYKDYSKSEEHSIGKAKVLLEDWSELDAFLSHFPSFDEPYIFDASIERAKFKGNRCMAGCFWRLFHERFWAIRGMENLMLDYYDEMDNLKILGAKFVEFYKGVIKKYKEIGCDIIFSSDDLGHQSGPMMSPAVFEELYLPLYKEIIGYTHSLGMKFMLHSCGDNTLLLPFLAKAGLDVFHPIQKGCMDYEETLKNYADKMTFLVGVDVQHLLPNGSENEIRAEIRRIKSLAKKYGASIMMGMGNAVMPDTKLENIIAAYDEIVNGKS